MHVESQIEANAYLTVAEHCEQKVFMPLFLLPGNILLLSKQCCSLKCIHISSVTFSPQIWSHSKFRKQKVHFLDVSILILKVSQCCAKNGFLKINRLELKRWAGLGGAHHQLQNSSVRVKQNSMASRLVELPRHNLKTEISKTVKCLAQSIGL